jgi:hypothetical protein
MRVRGMTGAGFGMKIVIFKMMTPKQRKAVLIRAMDMKTRKKELKINCLQQKIRLMQEKLEFNRRVREMTASSQGFEGRKY